MLTEADCKKVLRNYLQRDDFVIKKFDLKPISENAEGFMGDHFKLLITHELQGKLVTEHFFMKTEPVKNPAQQEMTQGLGMFKREIFWFDVLFKEFDKYGLDTSFASTSYYCLPETALIMEDLTLEGYAVPERREAFSLGHVRCVLDALAALHGCGYVYEEIKTREMQKKEGNGMVETNGKIETNGKKEENGEKEDNGGKENNGKKEKTTKEENVEVRKKDNNEKKEMNGTEENEETKEKGKNSQKGLFRLTDVYKEQLKESFYVQYAQPDCYAINWWTGSRKTILNLTSLLKENERIADFEAKYLSYDFGKIFIEDFGLRKTCGHGDLWSNNLMFKCENKVPVKCRLLDFQLTRYFYPALDVILAIFSNTDVEFRKLHLEGLYKYYFNSLREFLRKYGFSLDEIHPWEDFVKSIKIVMPDVMNQVLLVTCIVTLPKNMLSDIVNEEGSKVSDLMFDNSDWVVKAFKSDDVYREKILEIIEIFHDVLANL